jgi:hypothetical protein
MIDYHTFKINLILNKHEIFQTHFAVAKFDINASIISFVISVVDVVRVSVLNRIPDLINLIVPTRNKKRFGKQLRLLLLKQICQRLRIRPF